MDPPPLTKTSREALGEGVQIGGVRIDINLAPKKKFRVTLLIGVFAEGENFWDLFLQKHKMLKEKVSFRENLVKNV